MTDEPALQGYAEISEVDQKPLATLVTSLQGCTAKCDEMVECKGVKYTKLEQKGRGRCGLLGAPGAAKNDVDQIAAAETAKEKSLEKATKAKLAAIHRKAQQPVVTEFLVKPKQMTKQFAAANEDMKSGNVQEFDNIQAEAAKKISELRKAISTDKKPEMATPQLIQAALSAAKKGYNCAFAKKLRAKYIDRVKLEVERDERKHPGNLEDTELKEVNRANRIVSRRAKREARREMRGKGPEIEAHVMSLLDHEGGKAKAAAYLKELEADACEVEEIELIDVPKITLADSWKHCAKMAQNCARSEEIRLNCALTCKGVKPKK